MQEIAFDHKKITPSKLVCIGRNYVEHIYELGNEIPSSMVVFNKPNAAISDSLYFISKDTRFEGEICFLMKKGKIEGVGFGLDLTKADLQNELKKKGLPWERAKAFDYSAVLTPFVAFEGSLEGLRFELSVNGIRKQEAHYDLMIYKPLEMIAEIESFMTLEDGDIIMSGTPKGVGNYKVGDQFSVKVFNHKTLILEHSFEVKPQ